MSGSRFILGPTAGTCFVLWLTVGPDLLFDRSDGQTLGHDSLGEILLKPPVGSSEQRSGVAGCDLAVRDRPLNAGRQLEETQGVGHHCPAAPNPRRNLLVRVPEVVDQLMERCGLFQGVEIRPVKILDEGMLETVLVRDRLNDHRYCLETRASSGSPTTLTCNELELALSKVSNEQRL